MQVFFAIFILAALAITAGIGIQQMIHTAPLAWLTLLWALLPGIALLFMLRRYGERHPVLLAVAITLLLGLGLYTYIDAFYLHPVPLQGLAFISLPFYQWLGIALLGVALYFLDKRSKPENV